MDWLLICGIQPLNDGTFFLEEIWRMMKLMNGPSSPMLLKLSHVNASAHVWCWKLEKKGVFSAKSFHFLWPLKVIWTSNFFINPSGVVILKRWSFHWEIKPHLPQHAEQAAKTITMDFHLSKLLYHVQGRWGIPHTYSFYAIGPDYFGIHPSWIWMAYNLSQHSQDIISYLFNGHPFKREKKILWLNFICAFLWSTWHEQNTIIFTDKEQDYNASLKSMTF